METKFTLGPLLLVDARDRPNPEGPFICPDGRSPVAVLTGYYGAEETIANGRLYTVAPDLYEALRRLVEHHGDVLYEDKDGVGASHLKEAYAALAKARGE